MKYNGRATVRLLGQRYYAPAGDIRDYQPPTGSVLVAGGSRENCPPPANYYTVAPPGGGVGCYAITAQDAVAAGNAISGNMQGNAYGSTPTPGGTPSTSTPSTSTPTTNPAANGTLSPESETVPRELANVVTQREWAAMNRQGRENVIKAYRDRVSKDQLLRTIGAAINLVGQALAQFVISREQQSITLERAKLERQTELRRQSEYMDRRETNTIINDLRTRLGLTTNDVDAMSRAIDEEGLPDMYTDLSGMGGLYYPTQAPYFPPPVQTPIPFSLVAIGTLGVAALIGAIVYTRNKS